jgi:hypothetical protein
MSLALPAASADGRHSVRGMCPLEKTIVLFSLQGRLENRLPAGVGGTGRNKYKPYIQQLTSEEKNGEAFAELASLLLKSSIEFYGFFHFSPPGGKTRGNEMSNLNVIKMVAVFFLFAALAGTATADTGYPAARIRYLDGQVSLQKAQDSEYTEVSVNMPVEPGDQVWTGDYGRAEFELADGSSVRVGSGTRIDFQSIPEFNSDELQAAVLRLWSGSVYLETRDENYRTIQMQLDTPSCSVKTLSRGLYRVDLDKDRNARISVVDGVADVAGQVSSTIVKSGQRTYVYYGEDPEPPFSYNTAVVDDFDRWTDERRQGYTVIGEYNEVPGETAQYYPELTNNGSWVYADDYQTQAWRPYVDADWQPYSNGYWYPAGWGLTWVSYEPWGWAPYHYGRWDWSPLYGWLWLPGSVWSPAWVSWYVGPRYVGWAPLNYWGYPCSRTIVHDRVGGDWDRHRGDRHYGRHDFDSRSWTMVAHDMIYNRHVRDHRLSGDAFNSIEPGLYEHRIDPPDRTRPEASLRNAFRTGSGRSDTTLIGTDRNNPAVNRETGRTLPSFGALSGELARNRGTRGGAAISGTEARTFTGSPSPGSAAERSPSARTTAGTSFRSAFQGISRPNEQASPQAAAGERSNSAAGINRTWPGTDSARKPNFEVQTPRQNPSQSGIRGRTNNWVEVPQTQKNSTAGRSGIWSIRERKSSDGAFSQGAPSKTESPKTFGGTTPSRTESPKTFGGSTPSRTEASKSFGSVTREQARERTNASPAPAPRWGEGSTRGGASTPQTREPSRPAPSGQSWKSPSTPSPSASRASPGSSQGFRSVMREVFKNVPRSGSTPPSSRFSSPRSGGTASPQPRSMSSPSTNFRSAPSSRSSSSSSRSFTRSAPSPSRSYSHSSPSRSSASGSRSFGSAAHGHSSRGGKK